jgi:hypothetical protein
MIARLVLAMLLIFTGVACEKEVHEVRLDGVPQEGLEGPPAVAYDER